MAIRGSRRIGGKWEPVRTFAKVNPESPHWNPVLRRADDGRIELFFKVGRNCADWRTYVQESRDEGRTWSAARELVPGDVWGGRGPVKNKCLKLKNGRWLAPASREFDPADQWKLETLWRVFAEKGAHLLQPNCNSVEELLDAQAHPERHQNLMVKVCGFSARFVSLSKRFQDEVIARHRLR